MGSRNRNYRQSELLIKTSREAIDLADDWLKSAGLENFLTLFNRTAELDKRYWYWRIAILEPQTERWIGEVVIDAHCGGVLPDQCTPVDMLRQRQNPGASSLQLRSSAPEQLQTEEIRGKGLLIEGDCESALQQIAPNSVDLIFTSPPYYNARPSYAVYLDYQSYLSKLRHVFRACHAVLSEGRFLAVNTSPVLVRRKHRNDQSRRLAVPFDLHRILSEEGFDFIEDIIWVKPNGAGWASGRGRQFAQNRHPLAYKCVPVTEYILVYRKHTDRLIDWNIRQTDPSILQASAVPDGYERTNVWKIKPARHALHPAVFPFELAEKIVRYYSFVGDTVLDPFAGIGTTGRAAAALGRRFILIEQEPRYAAQIRQEASTWN